jgi:hypothetical protein
MCPERDDERVSLYGLPPEGALRALLAVKPDAAAREESQDDDSREGTDKAGSGKEE